MPMLPVTRGTALAERALLFPELRAQPLLLLRELAWRWLCGGALLLIAGYDASRIWVVSQPALRATGLFAVSSDSLLEDPSQLTTAFSAALAVLRPQMEHAALGLAPLAVFCWVFAFAWGRGAVLAHYDRRLPRRPWLLAACEGARVCGLLAASALWSGLIQLASAWALGGEAPNVLLYGVLALAATVLVLAGWGRVARALEGALAVALVEGLPFSAAFGRSWGSQALAASPGMRSTRKAAGRARLLLLALAFLCAFLPSPSPQGWLLYGWWALLSLVLLAAADAVRLGVLFAMLHAVRAAGTAHIAILPPEPRR